MGEGRGIEGYREGGEEKGLTYSEQERALVVVGFGAVCLSGHDGRYGGRRG